MLELCMLASGSSGNAVYVATEKSRLLIDAGLSGRRICAALSEIEVDVKALDALLLSHDHSDHICGAGILARRYGLPLYATAQTWQAACKIGPVAEENRRLLPNSGQTVFSDLTVETFPTPHDAAGPVGFVFRSGKHTVALVTDLGYVPPLIMEKIREADCLVLEANHDEEMLVNGTYPWPLKKRILGNSGHLSNTVAAHSLVKALGSVTKQVVLAHLSEHNNVPELAMETVCSHLDKAGFRVGSDIQVMVAKRHSPSCHVRLA